MTPKFSKSDVVRTSYKTVSLCNSEWAQFILKDVPITGEYEGKNYWNCFDIYDYGEKGIRFLVGNGAPYYETNKYSSDLLQHYGLEIRNNYNGTSKEEKAKRKELLDAFCDSINNGIHDPLPVTSFANFKKQLVEQKKMWPDKSYCSISQRLLNSVSNKEIKTKINEGIKAVYDKVTPMQQKNTSEEEKIEFTLKIIASEQRIMNLKKEQKNNYDRSI